MVSSLHMTPESQLEHGVAGVAMGLFLGVGPA